ncbi:TPA: fimbrial protein StaE [Citrobacter freundii]|nr:fimbrial protein StaE [Citrobacter freundii]
MKPNSLFLALVIAGGLFSGVSHAATTGTDSLAVTFSSVLIPGTCNFEVQDNAGSPTSAVDIGDIYKNDVGTDAAKRPFFIAFKQCAGVSDIYITAHPTAGACDSTNFPTNDATNTNTSIKIHQEEHNSKKTPHPLNCATTPIGGDDTIHHSFGASRTAGASVTFDMYATLVLANGKTASDIGVGDATAPVTFSISYE